MAIDGAAQTRTRLIELAQSLLSLDESPTPLILAPVNVLLAEDDRIRDRPDIRYALPLNDPLLILHEITLGYANVANARATLHATLAATNNEARQQLSEVLNQLRRAWLEGSYTSTMYRPTTVTWSPFELTPAGHHLYTITLDILMTVDA